MHENYIISMNLEKEAKYLELIRIEAVLRSINYQFKLKIVIYA